MAGAPAIAAKAERFARSGDSATLGRMLEERGGLDARDVGAAAALGDQHALDIIRESGRISGRVLATLVSTLNPSLVIVGGGVANIGHALLAEVRSAVYRRSLPLATRNLPVVLADYENLRVFTLPGMIRGITSAAVDAWTSRRLNTLTADVAIIGVNGMTTSHGLTTTNPEEAATKRAMLLSARRRVVPVISGKLGRNSFCSFAAVNEVDLVITDASANTELVRDLAAAGPEVVIA